MKTKTEGGLRLSRRQFTALAVASVATGLLPVGKASAQARGGTIVCPINQDPPTFCPGFGSSNVIDTVGGKIFQALYNLDAERHVQPVLAETVDVSADGLTYTFHLRNDVSWHDGKPFTADDVVFSLEVLPKFKSRTANALSKVAEIIKVDDHTVTLRLASPYLPFPLATAGVNMPMLPKHIYEGTDYLTNPANLAPVGTGPFKFKEFKRGEYVHLVRNEDYFVKDLPLADEIFFPIIPDAAQRAIAAETGQANVLIPLTYNDQDLDGFLASGKFKVIPGAYDGVGPTTKISVNKRHPILGDVRFRRAMMHAIDSKRVLDSVYFGSGRVMHGPFATGTAYYDEAALKKYDFDPAKAAALLDEMGLKPGAGGVRTTLSLIVPRTSAGQMRVQELVRLDLSAVGIEITLEVLDLPTYTKRETDWEYDLLMIGPGQFLDPDIGTSRFLLSSNIVHTYQANSGGYSNPRVDELWAKAVSSANAAEAQTYYSEIQSIVSEDVPDIWIVEIDQRMLASNQLEGFSGSPQESYSAWADVHFV